MLPHGAQPQTDGASVRSSTFSSCAKAVHAGPGPPADGVGAASWRSKYANNAYFGLFGATGTGSLIVSGVALHGSHVMCSESQRHHNRVDARRWHEPQDEVFIALFIFTQQPPSHGA